MSSIVRLALTSLAAVRLKNSVERAAWNAALLAVVAVLAAIGAGFFLSALWIWLARLHGSLAASAIIGAGFVALALVVYVYSRIARRRRVSPVPPLPDFRAAPLALPVAARGNVLTAALVVAGIGYVAGRVLVRK